MTTLAPALPGITFEVVPRPLDEALPRMDVCGFVGFASRGPIDVPVVVEDPVAFREIFGADPVVARTEDGVDVQAHLGAAVEAFFANGGIRAWVVRVAKSGEGGAVTNRFAVPGVLMPGEAADVDGWRLLALNARSPGAWSDGLTAGATLSVNAIVATLDDDPGRVVVDHGVEVLQGDLLRLLLGDGRSLHVVVTGVAAHPDGRAVSFEPAAGWLIDENPPLPPAGAAYRIGVGHPIAALSLNVDVGSVEPEVTVWIADGERLEWGDLVAFEPSFGVDGLTFMAIGDEHFDPDEMTDPSGPAGHRFVVAGTWEVAAGSDSWADAFSVRPDQLVVEVERLRLAVRDGEAIAAELDGLGLGREHPRAVAALPPDDLVYPLLAGTRRRELVADAPVAGPFERALTPFERETAAPRFPLAAAVKAPLLLPLTVTTDPTRVAFGPPPVELAGGPTPVRNGLETFGADLFIDPALADLGVDTILPAAWDVTSIRHGARRLRGIHALVTNEDVTLVCVPDAVHTGWDRMTIPLPDPLVAPALSVQAIDENGARVQWTTVATATGYEIEHDADPEWSLSTRTTVDGASRTAVLTVRERCPHYEYARVRARRGGELGPWSNTIGALVPATDFATCDDRILDILEAEPTSPAPPPEVVWRSRPPSEAAPWNDLRAIQTATLRWCAARGDVFAVLAMPAAFNASDALRHVSVLRGGETSPLFLPGGVRPLDASEAAVLGYGALYHPWPVVGRSDAVGAAGTGAVPPDGAVAGTYAARALARGAWDRAARVSLAAVLALMPAVDSARHLALALAGVNPIADDPSGFMALTSATMTGEAAVRPVNVRRLIMLLRRLARRAGDGIVFEPSDRELQRLVHLRFERLLLGMFRLGAFAGAVPAEAFEISTGDNVNPPGSVELGRFVVEVRFAPSRPLEFITVRLVLAGVAGAEARS